MTTNTENSLSNMLAERIYLKQRIETEAKQLTELRTDLETLDLRIRDILQQMHLDSITKNGYRASVEMKVGTRIADWEALYAHIRETGDFHLLQRRLVQAPFAEMHKQNAAIPGVETYEYPELSVRKVSTSSN